MKKVLALALAIVMVLSLGVTATANGANGELTYRFTLTMTQTITAPFVFDADPGENQVFVNASNAAIIEAATVVGGSLRVAALDARNAANPISWADPDVTALEAAFCEAEVQNIAPASSWSAWGVTLLTGTAAGNQGVVTSSRTQNVTFEVTWDPEEHARVPFVALPADVLAPAGWTHPARNVDPEVPSNGNQVGDGPAEGSVVGGYVVFTPPAAGEPGSAGNRAPGTAITANGFNVNLTAFAGVDATVNENIRVNRVSGPDVTNLAASVVNGVAQVTFGRDENCPGGLLVINLGANTIQASANLAPLTDTPPPPTGARMQSAEWRIVGINANDPGWDASAWGAHADDNAAWNALRADQVTRLRLTPSMFQWEQRVPGTNRWDTPTTNNANMIVTRTIAEEVTFSMVRTRNTATALQSPDIWVRTANGQAYLRMRTIDVINRTGTRDGHFDLRAQTRHGTGSTQRTAIVLSTDFTYGTERSWVYDGDGTFYRGNDLTQYIRAGETIRNVEIYAGAGVYVRTHMARNQNVYVHATVAMSPAAEELFLRHAALDTIITMYNVGLNRPAVTVDLTSFGTNSFFVFNAAGTFIGTTADPRLPWSDVFYLTTEMIDLGIGVGDVEEPAYEGFEPAVPGGGAPEAAEVNVNFNPGTGR